MSLTLWPCWRNSLAQWCAPEQAAMPMTQGGNCAMRGRRCSRDTFGLTNADLPLSSTPCTANTFLARSIPTVIMLMDENVSRNRSAGQVLTRSSFSPETIQHYFVQSASFIGSLRTLLPALYE